MAVFNIFAEFNVEEDVSFIWDEFKVVVERCDHNVMVVALYAISGEVKNVMGDKFIASESTPFQVLIPFRRIPYLMKEFQRVMHHRVISISYQKLDFLIVFTEPLHGELPKT